ncbi:AAA family ATPase [Paracoccus aminophilus]|uniref:AAA ATPase n=1 Tax=Paracoccus aminophilus JCM 7686 TaxID=1367847 RepID=S5XQ24_PARAH|nr:AAA family ATPase [Paracoccus aminophilus]AGT09474.1 AAA ATPase [Paracoccus aminophilus JCM 7686]
MRNEKAAQPGRQDGSDFLRSKGYWAKSKSDTSGFFDDPKSRFVLTAYADLPPPPPRREIIAGLLAEGEVMFLTGHPKAGKSVLAAHLAACVTRDDPFCGRTVARGPVVYLSLERHELQKRRIKAAGADLTQVFDVDGELISLGDEALMRELADAIAPIAARLVVIDTGARAMVGLDENSSRDMGTAMRGLEALRQRLPNAAIVVLHHLVKGGGDMRGSSAILAAADLELRVEASKGGKARTARVTGANDVVEGQELAFTLTVVDDEAVAVGMQTGGDSVRATAVLGAKNDRSRADGLARAMQLYNACPDQFDRKRAAEIAAVAGIVEQGSSDKSRATIVARLLRRLAEQGMISEIDGKCMKLGDKS